MQVPALGDLAHRRSGEQIRRPATNDQGRHEQRHLIEKALGQQAGCQCGSAFAQHVQHAAARQLLEPVLQAAAGQRHYLDAGGSQSRAGRRRRRAGQQQRAHLARAAHDLGVQRQAAATAYHDPRRTSPWPQANSELGIVVTHCAGADHHGVDHGAQAMHPAPARRARDPACVAAGRGYLAVQRHSSLVGDQRQAAAHELEEGRVLALSRSRRSAVQQFDRYAALAQTGEAAAVDERVGITQGDHGALDAGSQQSVGTRRRVAVVTAGLERTEEGGAGGSLAGFAQGDGLGVVGAGSAMPAASHDLPVGHQHGAHERIGVCEATASLGQPERLSHERVVPHRKTLARRAPGSTTLGLSSWSSLIRTVTVGPGVPPGQPLARVAGSHRRWGLSPRPEATLYFFLPSIRQGLVRSQASAGTWPAPEAPYWAAPAA